MLRPAIAALLLAAVVAGPQVAEGQQSTPMVGPNVTAAGVALAISTGYTFRAGMLNVPLNMALVPSRYGMRASMLTGFNIYR